MFLRIKFLVRAGGRYAYEIVDSRLPPQTIDIVGAKILTTRDLEQAAFTTTAVISFYQNYYPKEVARNVALFYKWWNEVNILIRTHKVRKEPDIECKWIDTYYPNLEYGKRYYNCVKNQITVLNFVKGK
jgi:hypothetical protein